jgi:EAL domain-containing protein (putative c-di-GMP-specific phosphodiesterase class I)
MERSDDQKDTRATTDQVEEFRAALIAGEVALHYQPQVDLRTGTCSGAEALLRWQHPTGGLLPPADFLPLLTHSTLMPTVTDWVILTACMAAAASTDDLRVAVNITASDACRGSLVESVRAALSESGLRPDRLTLELTEDSLVQDIDRATRNVDLVAADGVRIALDDFGTGYS